MVTQVTANNLSKIMEDISNLTKDIAVVGTLVDRFDDTIDKLTDISVNLSQLLAIHEIKINQHEVSNKQITDLIEKRRVEIEDKTSAIQARITSGEKEIHEKMSKQYSEIMKEIKEMRQELNKQHTLLDARITGMEKWMWIVIGGAVVIGGLLSLVPWDKLLP